jgi:hypothetical protein
VVVCGGQPFGLGNGKLHFYVCIYVRLAENSVKRGVNIMMMAVARCELGPAAGRSRSGSAGWKYMAWQRTIYKIYIRGSLKLK